MILRSQKALRKNLVKIPHEYGYYVYLLKCGDGSLYTGWTTNITQRFYQHAIGKGAKYTRAHLPLELYYFESFMSKQEALQREYEIKQLSRIQKIQLKKREQG